MAKLALEVPRPELYRTAVVHGLESLQALALNPRVSGPRVKNTIEVLILNFNPTCVCI